MAVGQSIFTNANGSVHMLHAQGAIAQFLTVKPTATAFRYTSVRFTSFGMAWFFENFDKGASAYLGETVTYTASRNCDMHEMHLFRYELPGLLNVALGADVQDTATTVIREVLHPDLITRYNEVVGGAAAIDVGDTRAVSEERFRYGDLAADHIGATGHRDWSGQPHYCDGVAIAAVKSVEYQLGGQRMDRHDKHALYTWLVLNSGSVGVPTKMMGLAESRENNDLELKQDSMMFQVKYLPLIFSFCRAPSMAAPLVSNMYNNLIIQAEFEPFSALIKNFSGTGNSAAGLTQSVRTRVKAADPALLTDLTGLGTTAVAFVANTVGDNMAASTLGGATAITFKRKWEDTLANSRARGRDLQTGEALGLADDAAPTATSTGVLAQADFPVSNVSRVFFLGAQERYAFASNAHHQIVEACQRVKHSTTQVTSKTYRTDTFQNACSWMAICPLYKPNLAVNEHFDYGGAWDFVRQRTFPAITTLDFVTNGANLYAETDESFYTMVQPYAHHSNVLTGTRRVYAMNFGIKANGRGATQGIGSVNLSRSTNSQVTASFAANLWAAAAGEADLSIAQAPTTSSTNLDVEFIVWNYNVLQYRGGIGGYKFTQSNNSL